MPACATVEETEATLYLYSASDTVRWQRFHDENHIPGSGIQINSRHKEFAVMESQFERAVKC